MLFLQLDQPQDRIKNWLEKIKKRKCPNGQK